MESLKYNIQMHLTFIKLWSRWKVYYTAYDNDNVMYL